MRQKRTIKQWRAVPRPFEFEFLWEKEQRLPKIAPASLTTEHLIDDYMRSPRWINLSHKTKRCYLSVFEVFRKYRMYNNKSLYETKAYQVTYSMVDYISTTLLHVKAPITIRSYYSVFSNVWDLAVRNAKVQYNPWLKPGLKIKAERDITFSRSQVTACVEAARELGYTVLMLYIIFCYETAQRPWKDLRNLTWDSIKDDENGGSLIDFTVSKTGTHLLLPLSVYACKILKQCEKKSSFIFVDEDGTRLSSAQVQRQFKQVIEKAGVPENYQIRDLRRTAITELAMAGCSVMEIEAITGWRCPEAVIRRYARVRLKTAHNALQKRQQAELQESTAVRGETQC